MPFDDLLLDFSNPIMDDDDVHLSADQSVDEFRLEDFSEFIGQKRMIATLKIYIQAAMSESKPLDPVLLAGLPGMGKTTLASLVATAMNVELLTLIMPVSDKTLQSAVTSHVGVLLLDEIHAAGKRTQESLQPLLEFGYMQSKSGYKITAHGITIIGATTEPQNVIKPLYDRFKIKPNFEHYSDEDMGKIVQGMARKAELDISSEDAILLGRATSGVPRNASRLVIAGRALQIAAGEPPTAAQILQFCDVDPDGFDRQHYTYMETLAKFGGTKGLKPIATAMRLDEAVVLDLEAALFAKDLIQYGTTGRELTSNGYSKIKHQKGMK